MADEAIDSSLRTFLDEGLITDVLGMVKSGKEGTVYCCRSHPRIGGGLVAAKVYRPRRHRSFRQDAAYQHGRVILDARLRPCGTSPTKAAACRRACGSAASTRR